MCPGQGGRRSYTVTLGAMYTSSGAACVRYGSVVTRKRRRGHPSHRAAGCQLALGQDAWSFAYLGSTSRPQTERPGDTLGYLATESDPQFASPRCAPTKGAPSLAIVIRRLCARRILRGSQARASNSAVDTVLLAMSIAPRDPMPLGTDSIMPTLHGHSRGGSDPARNPNTANGLAVPDCILANPFRSARAVLRCPWPTPVSHQVAPVVDEARIQHA